MKKVIALMLTCALILSAAGCNKKDDNKDKNDGQVTQVAFDAPEIPDTTPEAIEHLKGQIPLFAKYLEKRRVYPLTYEVEVPSAEGTGVAGIYIKDKDTVAIYSKDAAGNSSTTIYDGTKMWYIDDTAKIAYVRKDYPSYAAENMVDSYLLKIDVNEAIANTYSSGEKEFEGTLYKYESISTPEGYFSEYYYDMNTGDLKIVVANGSVSYVTALSNDVTEDVFKIPSDYEEGDLMAYIEELKAEKASAAE